MNVTMLVKGENKWHQKLALLFTNVVELQPRRLGSGETGSFCLAFDMLAHSCQSLETSTW